MSNFEVNLGGYRDIKDIAVTVKLPLNSDPHTSLLVWTTTPWTLPGNMAAAVHKDSVYLKVAKQQAKATTGNSQSKAEYIIVAKDRADDALSNSDWADFEIVDEFKGGDLVGESYQPPFRYWLDQEFSGKNQAWKIFHADYVDVGDTGTGAVHLAPALSLIHISEPTRPY